MEQKFLRERVIKSYIQFCVSHQQFKTSGLGEFLAEILGVATGGKWKQGWAQLVLQLVCWRGGAVNTTNLSRKQSVKHATVLKRANIRVSE